MMKNYIMINSLANGGAEQVVLRILNALNSQNFKCDLICLEKKTSYFVPDNINVKYLSNLSGNESHIIKMLYLPVFAWRLKKLIKQKKCIVQSHLYRSNYVNIIAKLLGSLHTSQLVSTDTVSMNLKGKSFFSKWVHFFLIKYLYKKADLLVFKSIGMMHDMKTTFKHKVKSTVINNPYPINDIIEKSYDKIDCLFEKKTTVVCVGRLIKSKNVDKLILIFHELLKEYPKALLLIVGDGPEKLELIKLVNKLKIFSSVCFTGNIDNPYSYVSRATIFISLSSTEGFPNVLVEAMICKTSVISTDCKSGPREILAPNTPVKKVLTKGMELAQYGILIPVGDSLSAKLAIIRLLEDQKLRKFYSEKGIERGLNFRLEYIAKKYKNILT